MLKLLKVKIIRYEFWYINFSIFIHLVLRKVNSKDISILVIITSITINNTTNITINLIVIELIN